MMKLELLATNFGFDIAENELSEVDILKILAISGNRSARTSRASASGPDPPDDAEGAPRGAASASATAKSAARGRVRAAAYGSRAKVFACLAYSGNICQNLESSFSAVP